MKTAQRLATAAIFFTAVALAGSVRAQTDPTPWTDSVLKAIPDDALGFVLVKNLRQTDRAISKLAAMVQAPVPSVLSLFKLQAGIQEGLDENGSAAVALLPGSEGKPLPVVLFPVTDYKKFIAQFQPDDASAETTGVTIAGHALIAGHKGSFALFTLPDQKERLAKMIASTKGVDTLIESVEPWIGRHQISLVATPAGSKMLFQAGAAAIKQFGPALSNLQGKQQSAQIAAAFKMYETVLLKASEEINAFGVGLNLDDDSNLSIDSHLSFVDGGDWAAAIKDIKPAEGDRFAGIPAASFVFAGQGVLPAEWANGLAEFSGKYVTGMIKAAGGEEITEDQRKEYIESIRSLIRLKSVSFVMSQPKPGGSIYDGIVELLKVDNAADFLRHYEKSIGQISEMSKGRKNFPFKFSEVKKIEIDGHAGLAITIDLSGMMAAQDNPEAAKILPKLFGPNGTLSMKIIAADEHTLVAAIGSDEHAKEALAAAKDPKSNLASNPDVAATLKLLPPEAQWVGLVNLKGYMDFIISMMSAVTPNLPVKLPELPAMPPLGFAAEAGRLGLDTQLVVPAETIVSLSKFVRHVKSDEAHQKPIEDPAP